MIIPSTSRQLAATIGIVAAIGGTAVACDYHRLGLTLAHYDARGHLVVARRIVDSLTPGWQQIGAVWLPLPHLLNALPVQIDAFYRTGASAVAISVLSFGVAAASLVWLLHRLTGSPSAALVGVAAFVFNPNILYLQATPMTESLLIGLTTLAAALLVAWIDGQASASAVGWMFALACLTRYEAWPVTVCALAAAVWTCWRRGDRLPAALQRVATVGVYPAVAILAFVVFSRAVVGQWFVDSGFFVPENKALGNPMLAAAEVWWGIHGLSGTPLVGLAAIGLAMLAFAGFTERRSAGLVALALGACASLPWLAFLQGHPFRIRYMVPLIAVEAVGVGMATSALLGWLDRRAVFARAAPAVVLAVAVAGIAATAYELGPFDVHAPMIAEAQWDRPNGAARERVTECLRTGYRGDTIMASMGSLGHYMQDTSRAGFRLRDFLHEGNGDLWLAALEGPRPYVGWVLLEEQAEGGDTLTLRARADPHFLDGFVRACEGAGVALYRREALSPRISGLGPHPEARGLE